MIILENEINHFFKEIFSYYPYEMIFAVQRKGMLHLKMIKNFRKKVGEKIFFLEAINFIRPNELLKKNILVYDDACKTGAHLEDAANRFKKYNCRIRTSCLAILQSSEYRPDFCKFDLSERDFNRLLSLSEDKHPGEEIYDDHLIYKIKVVNGYLDKLINRLKSYGKLYEIESLESNGFKSFTLSCLNFFDSSKEFNSNVRSEGVEKLRIFVSEDGFINIVPRVYPAVKYEEFLSTCKADLQFHVCELLVKRVRKNVSFEICSRCIYWTINAIAIKHFRKLFLRDLKKSGFKIITENINDYDLKASLYDADQVVSKLKNIIGIGG